MRILGIDPGYAIVGLSLIHIYGSIPKRQEECSDPGR